MNTKTTFICILLSVFLSSCSLIKSPKSGNFQRVKYNAHLKLKKSKSEKQITTWTDSLRIKRNVRMNAMARKDKKTMDINYKVYEKSPSRAPIKIKYSGNSDSKLKRSKRLSNERFLQRNIQATKGDSHKYWWDEDIEDWPWKQLILVLIALILISIIVGLLVPAIGGFLSGMIGLILILLLAYYLVGLWT